MEKPTFDPGLTQQFSAPLRRAINKDGTFNVRRRGGRWRDTHPYLELINMPWPAFLAFIFAAYLFTNTLFALGYFAFGADQLQGSASTESGRFATAFFFSAETLTTVGYGSISPKGLPANILAAMEGLTGLLGFAIATGLLYGRFSRPSAKIAFSERLIVTPYQDATSLQFRIVNQRANALMELEAIVVLMTVEGPPGKLQRNYKVLKLERDRIYFFPLTWTVVHPIDADSPLYGKTPAELMSTQSEFLILIKGWDETFSQTVHVRYSYRYDEIVWNARFAPAFRIDEDGDMVLEVDQVGRMVESAEARSLLQEK
jgi:inward rectifier potassium channel